MLDWTVVLYGLLGLVGALAYDIWSFLKAKNNADDEGTPLVFSWTVSASTILPSLVIGFLAAYAIHPAPGAVDYFAFLNLGFSAAAAQGMLGWRNFFRQKKA